jgi:hypothetical protein
MRFLFITTNNLSTNPRLKKEIEHASHLNHCVYLSAFKLGNWSDHYDQSSALLNEITIEYLSASRQPIFTWMRATLIHWISKWLWPVFKKNIRLTAYAHHKRSYQLVQALKKFRKPVDLVIAHNLGALYPAWLYARRRGIPFNFDVEDYYPGERIGGRHSREREIRKMLMQRLMRDAGHITYAAPLIGTRIQEEMHLNPKRCILINNTFPQSEFNWAEDMKNDGKIRMVWFSQKIGYYRGLESVIRVLAGMKEIFSLTLIGSIDPGFFEEHLSDTSGFITCVDPIPQEELHRKLGEFDVGMAIEDASSDINRDICLTNKIWAYYLSGLYILATDTSAQRMFLEERMDHGILFNQYTLEDALDDIRERIEDIRAGREKRKQKALVESFEAEIPKLEATWKI